MHKILLSASRGSWQMPAHHGSETDGNKQMKEVRGKVLSRDGNKCVFCGFVSPKWQEVHHLSDDHQNFDISNLATACPFCHQCFHLGMAGSSGGGVMIWLPELSQVELNHLARAVFVAECGDSDSSIAASARSLLCALESRGAFLEQHFSAGASDPGFLGQIFLAMKKADYEKRDVFLKNMRLLPLPGRFEPQIKYWKDSVYRDLPPHTWGRLIEDAKAGMGV